MFFEVRDMIFVFSFPQHHHNSNKPQLVDSYHMTSPQKGCFYNTESVHGLICFQRETNPIIWNPTTKKFLTLSEPEKRLYDVTMFLGYDPIEGKHKVVCVPYKTCGEFRVLTLGSDQESWRSIKTNHKQEPLDDSYGRCINGVLYYEARAVLDHSKVDIIMSFDVKSEKFNMIKLPPVKIGLMIAYDGRLACVKSNIKDGITLWILEDAEKHEWSCRHFLAPIFHLNLSLDTVYELSGATDAGDFVFVPVEIQNSFHIIYYDPKRNSLKNVEFKGIADKQFRLKNGLGNRILDIYTFRNHMESLMSL